jgi:hypothetical protein
MRSNAVPILTVVVAALVVNCSKFAIGGNESGILSDAQLAPLVIEPDDELARGLRQQAKTAMADPAQKRPVVSWHLPLPA